MYQLTKFGWLKNCGSNDFFKITLIMTSQIW